MKLSNAMEAIDDLMISQPSPDDDNYKALKAIKDQVESASKDASERAELVIKADQDPKLGWKTVTKYEEVRRQGAQNGESDKLWSSCYKQVQDAQKKKVPISQPFRRLPGSGSGFAHPG